MAECACGSGIFKGPKSKNGCFVSSRRERALVRWRKVCLTTGNHPCNRNNKSMKKNQVFSSHTRLLIFEYAPLVLCLEFENKKSDARCCGTTKMSSADGYKYYTYSVRHSASKELGPLIEKALAPTSQIIIFVIKTNDFAHVGQQKDVFLVTLFSFSKPHVFFDLQSATKF